MRIRGGGRRIRAVIGRTAPLVLALLLIPLAHTGSAQPEPVAEARPAPARQFHLFQSPSALGASGKPLDGLAVATPEPLLRLPGDPDSVFSLGGPAPSGQPRVRIAVEVNEVVLKLLSPDPKVDSSDSRPRAGGDWKPVDSMGRPYQLRLGARLIW